MDTVALFDSPITAVECTEDSTIYLAAGNAVYRSSHSVCAPPFALPSSSSSTLPHAATVRCVSAPPGTVITTLALASSKTYAANGFHEGSLAFKTPTIVFMGAADHLLAHMDYVESQHIETNAKSLTSSAAPSGCLCVLQTGGSRLLRISVDATHRTVLVSTASNDLFCLLLSDIAESLRCETTSSYRDVWRGIRHRRVRGPSLGVVLAVDILVDNFSSKERNGCSKQEDQQPADTDLSVPVPSCRLFAATYSGAVVEWYPKTRKDNAVSTVAERPSQVQRNSSQTNNFCVASCLQAHPSGCAIFSVRAQQSVLYQGQQGSSISEQAKWRTHLVTCSDDRSVTLYECQRSTSSCDACVAGESPQEDEHTAWVPLWRGSGTSFSKSRIFDVAVCAMWSPTPSSIPSVSSFTCWQCTVHVAAAGEDGSVQVTRIEHASEEVTPVRATRCFARARQHRGHGAYRLAFCKPVEGRMMLVSGGFDGTVFAHSYPTDCCDETDTRRHAHTLDIFTLLSVSGDINSPQLSAGSLRPFKLSKHAQVRVVHVDAAGHLLVCTNRELCVQHRSVASPRNWWSPLPNAVDDAISSVTLVSPSAYGLPACAESTELLLMPKEQHRARGEEEIVSVSCVIVGATTGALYAIPYACTRANGNVTNFELQKPSKMVATEAPTTCPSPLLATTALQPCGKVTHIALLNMEEPAKSDASRSPVLVATSHVRHAVVLSALHASFNCSASINGSANDVFVQLTGGWYFLAVLTDCPGPLTTNLTLIRSPLLTATETLSFWLLIGDKNGCLFGARRAFSGGTVSCGCLSEIALSSAPYSSSCSQQLPAAVSIKREATVCTYVFPEHLHIAISALCVEEEEAVAVTDVDGSVEANETCAKKPFVLRITGTGGAMAFLRLPAAVEDFKATQAPRAALSREPLRLPFDVSSILAMSSRVCVVQSGTTVSVLYRIPERASWVLVDAFEDLRAPRLLTARICESTQMACVYPNTAAAVGTVRAPVVYLAHCSDGHTVEAFASFLDRPHLCPTSELCARTSLLHGRGLPGKDYNCVTYAPAPLHCLLMGNEDSSLVVYPLRRSAIQVATASAATAQSTSLLSRFVAPINICSAHHSNILAIAVLPPSVKSDKDTGYVLRFVSVGGGAMVNLWASDDTTSPLRLLDWWCAGVQTSVLSSQNEEEDDPLRMAKTLTREKSDQNSNTSNNVNGAHRISSASFQKKRGKQALSSPSSALTERTARFMCVTAWTANIIAVGSSDGTVLFFRLARASEAKNEVVSCYDDVGVKLQLEWQGALNLEVSKPILSVSSTALQITEDDALNPTARPAAGLLVAGDTNGLVYVVDTTTHRVVAQKQLEQSAVNALSEVHAVSADIEGADEMGQMQCRWRFAAVNDSGVVHLVQINAVRSWSQAAAVVSVSADIPVLTDTRITVLSSASTGLTAGRSVRWPLASRALVAVTEERMTHFDAQHLQHGVLAVASERRVNVRCVSGAVAVPCERRGKDDDGDAQVNSEVRADNTLLGDGGCPAKGDCSLPHVAIVGQGFEVV